MGMFRGFIFVGFFCFCFLFCLFVFSSSLEVMMLAEDMEMLEVDASLMFE